MENACGLRGKGRILGKLRRGEEGAGDFLSRTGDLGKWRGGKEVELTQRRADNAIFKLFFRVLLLAAAGI